MPKLQIPERYRRAIAALPHLPDTQFHSLLSALSKSTNTDAAKIAAAADSSLPDGEQLVEAVLSFYAVPTEWDVPRDEFTEDLVEAVRPEWGGKPDVDPDAAEAVFRARLRALTSIDEVAVNVKATRVLTEYERPFQSARVFSDLRPVFGESVDAGVVGMGVIHTLKITYHTADFGLENFFVALTDADIQKLKATIERADAKAKALRQQLGTYGVRYLEGD